MKSLRRTIWLTLVLLFPAGAFADPILSDPPLNLSVTDKNSGIFVLPTVFGVQDWHVDSIDHMFLEQFWFRISGQTKEFLFTSLPLLHNEAGAPNHNANQIHITRQGQELLVDVLYTLNGGPLGSGDAKLVELITLTNIGTGPMLLNWFAYTDFQVNGTQGLDVGAASVGPTGVSKITQQEGKTYAVLSFSQPAFAFEMDASPVIIEKLDDLTVTNLNNATTPFPPTGPGDVSFALQWVFPSIAPGQSVQLTIEKQINTIPEPSALTLLGLVGLFSFLRKGLRL